MFEPDFSPGDILELVPSSVTESHNCHPQMVGIDLTYDMVCPDDPSLARVSYRSLGGFSHSVDVPIHFLRKALIFNSGDLVYISPDSPRYDESARSENMKHWFPPRRISGAVLCKVNSLGGIERLTRNNWKVCRITSVPFSSYPSGFTRPSGHAPDLDHYTFCCCLIPAKVGSLTFTNGDSVQLTTQATILLIDDQTKMATISLPASPGFPDGQIVIVPTHTLTYATPD